MRFPRSSAGPVAQVGIAPVHPQPDRSSGGDCPPAVWPLVAAYFPGALIADRTALENKPATDGSVCLIANSTRDKILPGLVLRPVPDQGRKLGIGHLLTVCI